MTDWPPHPLPPTVVICLHISFLSLPRRIAMQPSLILKISCKSVKKGQRYHLFKNVGGVLHQDGVTYFNFFYIILITLVSGQTC